MLGCEFVISRQVEAAQASPGSRPTIHAQWHAGLGGTKWIDELVGKGEALDLSGNGYPNLYGLSAAALGAELSQGLPEHKGPPVFGEDYFYPGGWKGEGQIDMLALRSFSPRELLLVEAWDMS